MSELFALVISAVALTVSIATAWLTLFRRGTVLMSQPTVIYFGPDTARFEHGPKLPKVYLRTLLFSTSKRGRVVENLFVKLSRNEMHQNFNIWVHGERDVLIRGSGLFVGETGIAADHHFLVPPDANKFQFLSGSYRLEVFAHLLGDRSVSLLFSTMLEVPENVARSMQENEVGVYFDWGPDAERYVLHVGEKPHNANPRDLNL